jgi:hypothetical protein
VIIVWGFRTFYRTFARGEFFCPRCGGDRSYRMRRARRYFTLFFIPLIPLQNRGTYVQCDVCRTNYTEAVLTRPTSGQLSAQLRQVIRAIVVNILRLGADSPAARSAAIEVVIASGTSPYGEAELATDIQTAPASLGDLLSSLDEQLTEMGKESLLTAGLTVARATGVLLPAQRALLADTGGRLGMTAAHVSGLLGAPQRTPQQD